MSNILKSLTAVFLLLAAIGISCAAPNPSGTGQPSANCQAVGVMPPGFGTAGFAHAGTVYAGSGPGSAHANNTHAVAQYDIACYQQAQRLAR